MIKSLAITSLAKMMLTNDETRLSASSGLMLDESFDAVNRSSSFERFVAARLPTDKFGSDLEAGFKIEAERGLVSETILMTLPRLHL
jgi:hypothetical protein